MVSGDLCQYFLQIINWNIEVLNLFLSEMNDLIVFIEESVWIYHKVLNYLSMSSKKY